MKILKKIMVVVVLCSVLALTACGVPPQPVSKEQYEVARQEALAAEGRASALERERNQLEAELNAKTAKLQALQEMEKGL